MSLPAVQKPRLRLSIVDVPGEFSRGVRQGGAVSLQVFILADHIFVDEDAGVSEGGKGHHGQILSPGDGVEVWSICGDLTPVGAGGGVLELVQIHRGVVGQRHIERDASRVEVLLLRVHVRHISVELGFVLVPLHREQVATFHVEPAVQVN